MGKEKERNYSIQDIEKLGKDIKSEIINRYKKNDSTFVDEEYESGIITTCAGLVSLLLLSNGLQNIEISTEEAKIIVDETANVASYIEKKGFDLTPFAPENKTQKFFSPPDDDSKQQQYYLDTVSWVLSLAVHLRYAHVQKKLTLETDMLKTVQALMKQTLGIVCDAALESGGWGFTNGCTKADLYFSYVISESLADFADYMNGELANKDEEILDYLGDTLVGRVEDVRKRTAKWLIDEYVGTLGDVLIDPDDPEGAEFWEKSDRDKFVLLYYTFFVIDMLIINKADEFFKKESRSIKKANEHGIYLSRIYLDKAQSSGKEWWTDPVSSSLEITLSDHPDDVMIRNLLTIKKIVEPGLVPVSLRCNALYTYYIAAGADNKLDDLFELLLENRHKESGLWDIDRYNILITERAIEGLVDYADYLKKYGDGEQKPSKTAGVTIISEPSPSPMESALNVVFADGIKKYLSSEEGKALIGETVRKQFPTGALGETYDLKGELVSIFAEVGLLVSGKELPSGVDKDDVENFVKNCKNLIFDLFYSRLIEEEENEGKKTELRKKLEDQTGEFYNTLISSLDKDRKVVNGLWNLLEEANRK